MKAILSGLIVDAKGKVGDLVAAHNHYGLFFRKRIDTPPSGSAYWEAIRDQTIALSAQWRTLSESERGSWNEAAKLFRRSDSLGLPYYQTGLNFFVGNNLNRWFCGDASVLSPPSPVAVPIFDSLSLSSNSVVPEKILTFSPMISSLYSIKLFVTNALNAGINRAFHQFRLLKMLDSSVESGYDLESDFVARFGESGDQGKKIFLKAIFVHRPSGLAGLPIYASSIIV
jgi:hypothetical protein